MLSDTLTIFIVVTGIDGGNISCRMNHSMPLHEQRLVWTDEILTICLVPNIKLCPISILSKLSLTLIPSAQCTINTPCCSVYVKIC